MPLNSRDMLDAYNEVFKGVTKEDRDAKRLNAETAQLNYNTALYQQSDEYKQIALDKSSREAERHKMLQAEEARKVEQSEYNISQRGAKEKEAEAKRLQVEEQTSLLATRIEQLNSKMGSASFSNDVETLSVIEAEIETLESEIDDLGALDGRLFRRGEREALQKQIKEARKRQLALSKRLTSSDTSAGGGQPAPTDPTAGMTSGDVSAYNMLKKFPVGANSERIKERLKRLYPNNNLQF